MPGNMGGERAQHRGRAGQILLSCWLPTAQCQCTSVVSVLPYPVQMGQTFATFHRPDFIPISTALGENSKILSSPQCGCDENLAQ